MTTAFEKKLGLAIALCAALSFGARAEDGPGEADLEAIGTLGVSSAVAADRSWLYNDPTRVAAPGRSVGISRITYAGGDSPTRPFAANTAAPGALLEAGGEVGLLPGLSAMAIGAEGVDAAGSLRTGALLGLRWSILPRSLRATQLVVSGGFLRELQGEGGVWARLALGHDEGRTRLALSVHGEHIFNPLRDGLDVMVTAGATVRLFDTVRAGLEYVGQDLEGTFSTEAEGGARHLLGPVVSCALFDEKLSLVGGPAVALDAANGQARLLGRVAVAWQF